MQYHQTKIQTRTHTNISIEKFCYQSNASRSGINPTSENNLASQKALIWAQKVDQVFRKSNASQILNHYSLEISLLVDIFCKNFTST